MDYLEKMLKLGADVGSVKPNPIDGADYQPSDEQQEAERLLGERQQLLNEKEFGINDTKEGSGYLEEALTKLDPGLVNKGMATDRYGRRRIGAANTKLLDINKQLHKAVNRPTPSVGGIYSDARNWWPWPNGV